MAPTAPDLARWPAAPVAGRNLRPGTFADQLGPGPTLVVFPRHLGCLFTADALRGLRATAAAPGFPRVVVVHQGTPSDAVRRLAALWPDAPTVADPDGALHRAAGVERGSPAQVLGPRAAVCALRALRAGARPGRPVGDTRTLPVALLVVDGRVVWEHRGRHSGDHPDWGRVPRTAGGAAVPPH
ncbi:MAG TPA: AhpC/TSA family protein [Miltoncostaeaceae bacterium]|nr:AhpC/TSA family protein [Miltoncostaeaceae bacterium]